MEGGKQIIFGNLLAGKFVAQSSNEKVSAATYFCFYIYIYTEKSLKFDVYI